MLIVSLKKPIIGWGGFVMQTNADTPRWRRSKYIYHSVYLSLVHSKGMWNGER